MNLIDSDVAIDHFHGHRRAMEYFEESLLAGEMLAIFVASLTEILAGMRAGEQERTEKLFGLFSIVGVDEAVARKAGQYLNEYRRSHKIEIADALIAATAFVSGAKLITRNVKHYPMVDILVVEPYERGAR